MNILGLTITRTKAGSLSTISGSRGWWPIIHEMSTGGWQRNETLNVDTVLTNPTLFACVTLIASDIAKLRPKLVEQDRNGIWNEVDSAAFSPFLRKPNHYQNWIEFVEWWMISKLVHGNTYVLKARDGRGVVVAGYILDPYRVTPLVAPDGSVFYQLTADPLADLQAAVVVPQREIIHDVCCPLFHPLIGVTPIYAAGWPAMQGLNIRTKSDKFFANGSRPGGVLIAPGPISQANADELKTNWQTNFGGDNLGKIAVLEHAMQYQPLGMTNAVDAQLIEQLHMSDEDIAKCHHMPRHKVGVGPDPTFNNIESLNKIYYSDCLQSPIEKLEAKLDTGLEVVNVPGRTLGIELDRSALFEMDTTAKADAATKAITAGMSPNEVRFRFYDLGPTKGGESPMIQQQNFSLEALAERDANKPFAKPEPAPTPAALPPGEPAEPEPEDETKDISVGMILAKVAEFRQASL